MNTAYQGSMIRSMIRGGHGGGQTKVESSPMENIAKDIETTDTDLNSRFQRHLMWQITAEEVVSGEVDARTRKFSFDLCAYSPLVWMGTIVDRAVVERLGNVMRFAVNGL